MIKLQLYNIKVTVKVYKTLQDMKRDFKKFAKRFSLDPDTEDDAYAARTVVATNQHTYLLFIENSIDINTITHEVYHLTNIILSNQGVVLKAFDDENFAILNGFLNQEVFKYLRKKKIKINDLEIINNGRIREQQADKNQPAN